MKKLLLPALLIASANLMHASAQPFKKIHQKAIVIDTHNDFISTGIEKGKRSVGLVTPGKSFTGMKIGFTLF